MGLYHLTSYPVPEFPRVTHFGYCNGESGRTIGLHYHLGFEVVYIKRSSMVIDTIPNTKPISLMDDSVLVMPPLREHRFRVRPTDVEYFWIGIQSDENVGISDDHRIPPHTLIQTSSSSVKQLVPDSDYVELQKLGASLPRDECLVFDRFPEVAPIFEALYSEIFNEHPMRVFIIYARIIELMSLIHRRLGSHPHSTTSATVNLLMDHIHAHFAEDLTLESLAKYAGFHPSYLSRLFQRETGTKISAYVRQTRLQRARELLIQGESVAKIAKECGFKSIYAFTSTFKRSIGCSPTNYRRTSVAAEHL